MMDDEAQKLLMMFVKDGYKGGGKTCKATAIAMMKFVAANKELQRLVCNSDYSGILAFNPTASNKELK